MAKVIRVPELGIAIANVTINRWFVQEGGDIAQGQSLLEVQTDKVTVEIPADASGVLLRTFFEQGAQMTVGTPIAVVGGVGEDITRLVADIEAEIGGEMGPQPAAGRAAVAAPEGTPSGRKPLASPLAKRLAREHGVDLSRVAGSGPGGRITERDVLAYKEQVQGPGSAEAMPAVPPAPVEAAEADLVIPLAGVRKVIADNVVASVRTSPRYTVGIEIDCSDLVRLRATLRDEFMRAHGVELTYVPFMVKAMARAVADVPLVNATVRDGRIIVRKIAHVGVAVASGDLLLVPVIRDPLHKALPGIAQELQEHVRLARENRLGVAHMQGGTITLTNIGVTDVDVRPGIAVINQPQVAIVMMGRVRDRVVAVDGAAAIRPIMDVTFTYDHRVVMGVPGGRYAERVKYYLESPESLIES